MRRPCAADACVAAECTDPGERRLSDAFDLDLLHAGDEALFARLVRDYSPRLLPHLRRYAGADADVHDLLQETWLRVYRKRRTIEGRGSFFGWLLKVTRTVGLAAVRRRQSEPVTEELRDMAAQSDLDTGMLRHILQEA
ncbi:MAG: RNA polymerase sigma factor, partial [Longimicrobiales bacterium]